MMNPWCLCQYQLWDPTSFFMFNIIITFLDVSAIRIMFLANFDEIFCANTMSKIGFCLFLSLCWLVMFDFSNSFLFYNTCLILVAKISIDSYFSVSILSFGCVLLICKGLKNLWTSLLF